MILDALSFICVSAFIRRHVQLIISLMTSAMTSNVDVTRNLWTHSESVLDSSTSRTLDNITSYLLTGYLSLSCCLSVYVSVCVSVCLSVCVSCGHVQRVCSTVQPVIHWTTSRRTYWPGTCLFHAVCLSVWLSVYACFLFFNQSINQSISKAYSSRATSR